MRQLFQQLKDQKGFVTITTAVIIFFTTLILALSIQFAGIGVLQTGYLNNLSAQAYSLADGCLEEAMLRLTTDDTYTGGTVTVGDDYCTITVTGAGATRNITSMSTVNDIVNREIEADVTITDMGGWNDVVMTDWMETIN